jgi:hypothetical protein
MINYPIGKRGEGVVYQVDTNTFNCAKAVMQSFNEFSPSMSEYDGGYDIEIDAYAHDVVRLVEVVNQYCDDRASVGYCILDDETQDWAACLSFENHKLVEVEEEAVEI